MFEKIQQSTRRTIDRLSDLECEREQAIQSFDNALQSERQFLEGAFTRGIIIRILTPDRLNPIAGSIAVVSLR